MSRTAERRRTSKAPSPDSPEFKERWSSKVFEVLTFATLVDISNPGVRRECFRLLEEMSTAADRAGCAA